MLIGIDASRAVAAHPTGTETYSGHLIQALLALQSQREWASHRFRLYFRDPPVEGAFPGVDVRHMPFPRLWTHLRLSWEMARRPPDVLFVPAHVLPLVHPRVNLVTVHDLGYLHFPQAHPWPQRMHLDLSTRWNARVATHVLAVSEATKADLVSYYQTPPDKITVAYHGCDETLAPVRDPARIEVAKARYAIDGDYFLYLGTLQPRKNLARTIDAFAAIETDATLVLAGKRGWLCGDLADQVQRLGLENRVLFPGYVPEEDKAALLSGALAFVFPSLYEGFGLPVLEAQACGCPVITSTTSSLPEVTPADAALLVDPEDTAAINVRRFSWATCARTVLHAIERCTAGQA
jgi:glycosyltransferase involved in cell wall biosynthesis